ncbi:MAG: flavodoxin domain-containing protein [Candidatus Bathyarchaeota archaeon]|nr:flavodoxin domain-containing protein [Candidatus Bathyarchaeota archaeon]MDW8040802.1 flavodoxin domain-containing protein [Nitrososphaerota archaeon]
MVKIKISEDIFWVGIVDWDVRDFHGYLTEHGTTYNAYLIVDEKTALVDTVKYPFHEELVEKINEIIGLEQLDYIVINHVEMDHSSALPYIIKEAKNAKIVASKKGKESLTKHYGENLAIEAVKTGDRLKLGKRTLTFIEAPMLHWPDSMFTYVVEDAILMPNDAFGQHLATSARFDDEVDEALLMREAAKYYANILMPLSELVKSKIQEIIDMKIPIRIIAPSHGVIWRSNPVKIVEAYRRWSEGVPKDKAVIVYDSMWGSTAMMARAIADGIASQGVEVKFFKLRESDVTEIVTEILEAKAVVVGSPTLNNSMFPAVSAFLTYVTGLKPKGKLWAFFGSYGWGGGAVKQMMEITKKAGFEVYESPLEVRYVPTSSEIKECLNFGRSIAQKMKSY